MYIQYKYCNDCQFTEHYLSHRPLQIALPRPVLFAATPLVIVSHSRSSNSNLLLCTEWSSLNFPVPHFIEPKTGRLTNNNLTPCSRILDGNLDHSLQPIDLSNISYSTRGAQARQRDPTFHSFRDYTLTYLWKHSVSIVRSRTKAMEFVLFVVLSLEADETVRALSCVLERSLRLP
jgi:hypothetical protein